MFRVALHKFGNESYFVFILQQRVSRIAAATTRDRINPRGDATCECVT